MNSLVPVFSPTPLEPERLDWMTNQLESEALRVFVKAAADATQTHPDFVLVNVLGTLSAALNGKFQVSFRSQTEPVQLYLMAIAEPGERKSAVVRLTKGPLSSTGHQACQDEDAPPSMYVDNITPNALAEVMSKTGGRAAVHSAEGGSLLQIMSDRKYPLAVFCNAYDAEDVHLDRAGKKSIDIPDAAMSICMAVQPGFAIDFARAQNVREQGLLARFLMVKFPSLAGRRQVAPERIPQSVQDAYEDIVQRLWRIPAPNPGSRYNLELTSEAQQLYIQFATKAEMEQGDHGRLAFDRAWGSKFCGKVLRMAAVLHCASHDDPLENGIDATALQQAIGICGQFRLHAQRFYSRVNDVGADSAQVALELALDWVNGRKAWPSGSSHGEFCLDDLLKNTSLTRRQAVTAIERLLQDGLIREDLADYHAQCTNWGRGRKRSSRYFAVIIPPYVQPVVYPGGWQ